MTKDDLIFKPVQAGRASEDVALQIEAAIVGGELQPGEGLPSERELQTQFGTGRGVIREALRALREKGLLEIRKGAKGGAFVKRIEVANVSESLALFLKQQPLDTEQLIEFRESVDRTITQLAIARASQDEKRSLVASAAKLEEAAARPEPDMAELAEMDRQLNIQLATMSRNPIFEWIMRAVQLGFSSNDYALYEDAEYRRRTAANWSATAREIAAGEPFRALSSIGNHYVLLRNCMQERNARDPKGRTPFREEPETNRAM